MNTRIMEILLLALAVSGLPGSARAQWVQTNGPWGGQIECFVLDPVSGDLFAGAYRGGVFRSTDQGESWTTVNNGLSRTDIAALAANTTGLFAGISGDGVLRSTDGGGSWVTVNTGLTSVSVQALLASGTDLFVGTYDQGVFRSTDNGEHWSPASTGLTNTNVKALAVPGNWPLRRDLGWRRVPVHRRGCRMDSCQHRAYTTGCQSDSHPRD